MHILSIHTDNIEREHICCAIGNDKENTRRILTWLLEGDVAIQYQAYRDLLDTPKPELQQRISNEGWGRAFLDKQNPDGHWGQKYYQPKWISTHYTLLDLKNLQIKPDVPEIRQIIDRVLKTEKGPDGGVLPIGTAKRSDVCVNGMLLNVAAYFRAEETDLQSVVDFLLSERVADGGFNCRSNRKGCVHSSCIRPSRWRRAFWSTSKMDIPIASRNCSDAAATSQEFMLMHSLFKSDKTGLVIDAKMTKLRFPSRSKYDILRALDYFQKAECLR